MPGIVVFRRRWSVGSDDLVVPGVFLCCTHILWIIILSVALGLLEFDRSVECVDLLWKFVIAYLALTCVSMLNELVICIVSMRGSILNTKPRASMQYLLYCRCTLMVIETGGLIAGIVWLVEFYPNCPFEIGKQVLLGLVICNWFVVVSITVTVWCTYDAAGRSWVKMKQYQRSMRESESKFQYKRSGSTRNWRQRKVLRAYQDSWQTRCRFLFCCMRPSDRNRNSFADIARLLSDFFRDLDVVPSDVVAGLVLLRKFQKIERKAIVEQRKNGTYEFLSGVAITPRTQFLSLQHDGADLDLFQTVIHYANFAVRAYGWPIYLMTESMGFCTLCANLSCCCCTRKQYTADIVDDNCCRCNYAVLHKLTEIGNIEIIYATYHVDVGETPFFVAIDYDRRKIVISIRGTLSMKDILTDLNAEGDPLPVEQPQDDWLGHKGMVQAAKYIYDKLRSEELLERAFQHNPERETDKFQIVTVGHSLGAGTASILSILLRQHYPDLTSYCYSPPGGLLSMPAVEYTKSFTISVVMGKDVVPRIGLHQMEALRADLINAIKRSVDPKWKTIACSMMCCGCGSEPTSAMEMSTTDATVCEYMKSRDTARCHGVHPSDSTIALTSHQPLYPPGRIIHVVRHHPTPGEQALSSQEPVFQALWAHNTDFDEVLISPVMIQDHMPDAVLDALNKVVTTLGPRKPQRSASVAPQWDEGPATIIEFQGPGSPSARNKIYLETSFTSLPSPSVTSSVTNGFYSTRSDIINVPASSAASAPSPLPSAILNFLQRRPKSQQETVPPRRDFCLTLKRANSEAMATTSAALVPKIDLIHDDWFGLAPLASPESLSEVSSISSRAGSFVMRTPKMMRRTPKIDQNLSTAADDVRNVRNFQKLRQLSIGGTTVAGDDQRNNGSHLLNGSSSSNLSYESAANDCNGSLIKTNVSDEGVVRTVDVHVEREVHTTSGESDDFQSAENILDSVMQTAGVADFFNSGTPTFMETHFDESMFGDDDDREETVPLVMAPPSITSASTSVVTTPVPIGDDDDPDLISNLAVDLQLEHEQRSMQYHQLTCGALSSNTNSIDSGSVCRTPSDVAKNVHFAAQVINIDDSPKRPCDISLRRTDAPAPKTILCPSKRRSNHSGGNNGSSDRERTGSGGGGGCGSSVASSDFSDDFFCAAKSEALPLLSGLCEPRTTSSPSYVRRKKYVYPIVDTFVPTTTAVATSVVVSGANISGGGGNTGSRGGASVKSKSHRSGESSV